MKRLSILICCFATALAACKKNSAPPAPTTVGNIVATINGTTDTFAVYASNDTISAPPGQTELAIGGCTDSVGDFACLTFFITAPGPIVPGVYQNTPLVGAKCLVQMEYQANYGNVLYNMDSAAPYTAVATLTGVSDGNVQGTFRGTVNLFIGDTTVKTVTVTDGKFNVNKWR